MKREDIEKKIKSVGGVLGMPDNDYHQRDKGLSSSSLKTILRSPQHYKSQKPYDNPTLLFGRLCHTAFLEPHEMTSYATVSTCDAVKASGDLCGKTATMKTSSGGAVCGIHAKGKEPMSGVTIVSEDDFVKALNIASACVEFCREIGLPAVEEGVAEASLFYEYQGQMLKIRPDLILPSKEREGYVDIVDLKTTFDSRPKAFRSTACKFNYALSAGFYIRVMEILGFKVDRFLWLAVEREAPHGVMMHQPDSQSIRWGGDKAWKAIHEWIEFEDNGSFMGGTCYPSNITHMDTIPVWQD